MFERIFDFFPFNMASGPQFLLFYAALSAALLGAAHLGRRLLVAGWPSSPVFEEEEGEDGEGGYRANAGGEGKRRPLAIGWIPTPEEYLAVAYLKGGNAQVARTMLACAFAEQILRPGSSPKGNVHFYPPPKAQASSSFGSSLSWSSSSSAGSLDSSWSSGSSGGSNCGGGGGCGG
jgi:hypothetical protein